MDSEKTYKYKNIITVIIRIAVALISLGMIYWYLISHFTGFGLTAGIGIFSVLLFSSIFYGPLSRILKKIRRKKPMKIITDILLILVILFFIYAAAAVGLMIHGSKKEPAQGSTVVVLGCQVRGNEPSLALRMRMDAAYGYLIEHPEANAVLSGGQGKGENISEAQCMYDYLTAKGIDGSRLYLEDRSTTTQENIRFSREIIEKNGLDPRLAVVTDWYHEFRAGIICDRQGAEHGAVSADTAPHLTANLVTREIFAIPNEILFKR